ncbi:MAG: hypothetical protein ACXWDB_01245 [Aeromicrobium sp.]
MITVMWNLASGEQGEVQLEGGQKWTFGRGESSEDRFSVRVDDKTISRSAVVIRDSGPGPVVFRGQRDNGAEVGIVQSDGSTISIEEGTAQNLSVDAHRVEFYTGGNLVITVTVTFDERPSVLERQRQTGV